MIKFIFYLAFLLSFVGTTLSDNDVNGETLKKYNRKKFDGNAIWTQTVLGEVQCSIQCTTILRSSCSSLSYSISTKLCRIFDNSAKYLSQLDDDDDVNYQVRIHPRLISNDFVAYPLRNYPKGTILTVENVGFKSCVMKCKELDTCKSFTYYDKEKKCQLKNDWPVMHHNLQVDKNAKYFTKKEYPIANYIVYMKKDLPGYKICRLDDISLKQCAMECDKRKENCMSFSYSPSKKYCVLKSKKVRMMKRLNNDQQMNYYQKPNYYKMYKNTYYPVGNIQSFDKISVKECKYSCELNSLCKGFVYKYDLSCHLKGSNPDKYENLQSNQHYDYYQKIDVEGYMIQPAYDYPDYDLDVIATINPYLCAKSCELHENCRGFVISKQKCTLKTKIGKDKDGWIPSPDSYIYVIRSEKKITKLPGYLEFEDKTYKGQDLFWMRYNEKKECMETCKNLTICKGFVVYDEKCWFKKMAKNHGENYIDKMNAVLYIKTRKPMMVEGYDAYENKYYTGFDHSNYNIVDTTLNDKKGSMVVMNRVQDALECSRKCTMYKECKGFVIRLGKCWLKTQAEAMGPNFVDSKLSTLYLKKWRKCEY